PSALLAILALSGCATVDYLANGERLDSLQGQPQESIHDATVILFHDGRLIVGNGGDTAGVAIIDTGTGLINRFYSYGFPPTSLAIDQDDQLFVFRTLNGRMATSVIDLFEE